MAERLARYGSGANVRRERGGDCSEVGIALIKPCVVRRASAGEHFRELGEHKREQCDAEEGQGEVAWVGVRGKLPSCLLLSHGLDQCGVHGLAIPIRVSMARLFERFPLKEPDIVEVAKRDALRGNEVLHHVRAWGDVGVGAFRKLPLEHREEEPFLGGEVVVDHAFSEPGRGVCTPAARTECGVSSGA